MIQNVYLGNTKLNSKQAKAEGEFVTLNDEKFYKIGNYHIMPDFFMSIVSFSDHWMFLSSNGSITAGRKDRNNALFPYYTDDKIHDYRNLTGSKTLVLATIADKTFLWKPFDMATASVYDIERNIYKNIIGNKVIFEEVNRTLGLTFKYAWYNSEKFGFIKKSHLSNQNTQKVVVNVMDGLQNMLPYGVDFDFQNAYSNLLDAYKKNEMLPKSKLGIFALSSIPVDRPEPSESLKATTVWSVGLPEKTKYLISNKQLQSFENGLSIHNETDIRASRACYFVNPQFEIEENQEKFWYIIADINQDSTAIANLQQFIEQTPDGANLLEKDIAEGTYKLKHTVASADGLQMSNEPLNFARHFSNTLFNVMRGGIFKENYQIQIHDFILYINETNKKIAQQFQNNLRALPPKMDAYALRATLNKTNNADLLRLYYEYLPLTFSRRHGDPSRPWNQFSIDTKDENGNPKYNYQGNWRDIFQNWEALGLSYPEFVENMITKFVNATTADGYNPYRIMREGIDWEVPDPNDPWAFIGYWGDHQIIYLQKLLELSNNFHPGKIDEWLTREWFVYANVPYRIKAYEDIVKDPKDTIVFDWDTHQKTQENAKAIGADGRMILTENQELYKANLTEKILVTLLAKLSNFVPEAGIWLNTQRPEWNDANNALVGNGVSMVTLYYLRRFLRFWEQKFASVTLQSITISEEVASLLDNIHNVFKIYESALISGFSNVDRRKVMDGLGKAGSEYRNKIYTHQFSGTRVSVKVSDLVNFCQLSLAYIDQSIDKNKRPDGLYHAYNLISITDNEVSIRYLYEMLEGQVAVLSAGYLDAQQSLSVLDALKSSKLFRADQYSYILYPDRQLPLFVEKNNIPQQSVERSKLLKQLLNDKNTDILKLDNQGNYHFNGTFRNAYVLRDALDNLDRKYHDLVHADKKMILEIYEQIFDHQSFTGRSGTFYGYEGLGSIYWHMVSKLLLATQESYFNGVQQNADPVILGKLKDHYYEIKAGIGVYKSPDLYGAFPTDPYSHTPGGAGVKQPGMTGQVKEDFISRLGELGVHIENGKINFGTSLLNNNEILTHAVDFNYYDVKGNLKQLHLNAGQIAFTYCQVPVIYTKTQSQNIRVYFTNGQKIEISGNSLDADMSLQVFKRQHTIDKIEVDML